MREGIMIMQRLFRLWQLIVTHKWQLVALFMAVLLPLSMFGALADEVVEGEPFFFDDPILLFMHSLASPFADSFMLLITRLGTTWGVVPVDIAIWCLLLARRSLRQAAVFGLSVGGAALLNRFA